MPCPSTSPMTTRASMSMPPRRRSGLEGAASPVHLYGQLADMASIRELAVRTGLFVIEDACQAHGASRDGNRAGSSGDSRRLQLLSDEEPRRLWRCGRGRDDDEALAASGALREHGQRREARHELVGYTARLDAIQAAVLAVQASLSRRLERVASRCRPAPTLDLLAGVGDADPATHATRKRARLAPLRDPHCRSDQPR